MDGFFSHLKICTLKCLLFRKLSHTETTYCPTQSLSAVPARWQSLFCCISANTLTISCESTLICCFHTVTCLPWYSLCLSVFTQCLDDITAVVCSRQKVTAGSWDTTKHSSGPVTDQSVCETSFYSSKMSHKPQSVSPAVCKRRTELND